MSMDTYCSELMTHQTTL